MTLEFPPKHPVDTKVEALSRYKLSPRPGVSMSRVKATATSIQSPGVDIQQLIQLF